MHLISQTVTGHQQRVWDVAVHPRLNLLASCSADKTAKIWALPRENQDPDQTQSLSLVSTLEDTHQKSIRSVSWKPVGPPCLAMGSFDSTTSIYMQESEVGGNGEEDDWTFLASIEGHENEVKSVAWSHDGMFLATCSRDKSVWIWEADESNEEFECISVLQEHTQDVKHVTWHPRVNILASASYDDTIRLWREDEDGDDWTCIAELESHSSTVWSCDFASDMRLVSCSSDETCIVWKKTASSERESAVFKPELHEQWEVEAVLPKAHTGPIYSVAWGKHNNKIASAGADGNIVVYSQGSEGGPWQIQEIQRMSHGVNEINSIGWALNDTALVSAGDDGLVKIWRL